MQFARQWPTVENCEENVLGVFVSFLDLPNARAASDQMCAAVGQSSVREGQQDLSLLQPVRNARPWPGVQRFDFLVRTRELGEEEAAELHDSTDEA